MRRTMNIDYKSTRMHSSNHGNKYDFLKKETDCTNDKHNGHNGCKTKWQSIWSTKGASKMSYSVSSKPRFIHVTRLKDTKKYVITSSLPSITSPGDNFCDDFRDGLFDPCLIDWKIERLDADPSMLTCLLQRFCLSTLLALLKKVIAVT